MQGSTASLPTPGILGEQDNALGRNAYGGGGPPAEGRRPSLAGPGSTVPCSHLQTFGDDADVEKAMLLAAVTGLREAAEAAVRRAEAAEAACLAPLKQAMEAHLREYREHLVLELRAALQREVSEATAELRATAHELRTVCRPTPPANPLTSEVSADVLQNLYTQRCSSSKASAPRPVYSEDVRPLQLHSSPGSVSSRRPSAVSIVSEAKSCAVGESPAGATITPLGLSFPVPSASPSSLEVPGVLEEDPPAIPAATEEEDDSEDLEVGRRRSVRDVVSHFEKHASTRSANSQQVPMSPPPLGANLLDRVASPETIESGVNGLEENRVGSEYCRMPLPLFSSQAIPDQLTTMEPQGAERGLLGRPEPAAQ